MMKRNIMRWWQIQGRAGKQQTTSTKMAQKKNKLRQNWWLLSEMKIQVEKNGVGLVALFELGDKGLVEKLAKETTVALTNKCKGKMEKKNRKDRGGISVRKDSMDECAKGRATGDGAGVTKRELDEWGGNLAGIKTIKVGNAGVVSSETIIKSNREWPDQGCCNQGGPWDRTKTTHIKNHTFTEWGQEKHTETKQRRS